MNGQKNVIAGICRPDGAWPVRGVLATKMSLLTELGSLRDMGVYELAKDWTLRFKVPSSQTNVADHVSLAEDNGRIAILYNNFLASKAASLWLLNGTELSRFEFPKAARTK